MNKHHIVLSALLGIASMVQGQPLKTPAPSPLSSIKQDFALSSIEISYSRPAVRGRTIFGDLVPYGKVWRTGANSATTINFGEEVTINGTKIKAGKYGLLTIPNENSWTIIITKQLDVSSPAAYKTEQDVVRVEAPVTTLPFSVENFTIMPGNINQASCEVWIMWDKTFVALPITVDVDSQVMQQIDRAMNIDNRPYFSAAMYYLENNKDLNKALEWFNKAGDNDPKAYWVQYRKAVCLDKLGKKQEAIATAEKSMALAKDAKNDDYVKLNEDLLRKLK